MLSKLHPNGHGCIYFPSSSQDETMNEIIIAIEMELTKIIQYLKIRLKLMQVLFFTGCLKTHTRNLGCACAHVFQKTWCALIGASSERP